MKNHGRNHLLYLIVLLLIPFVPKITHASEYKVEIFEHLCDAVNNDANYSSSKLKALKYLTEGKNGWVYRSKDDFIEDFDKNISYQGLKELNDLLVSRGIRLVLVYLPTRALMTPGSVPRARFDFDKAFASYKAKLKKLRQVGILVPDTASLVTQYKDTDFYFKRDIHWTPFGARKTAELTAQTILQAGLIEPLTGYQFTNDRVGSYTISGFMQKGIKQLCGSEYIKQYFQAYTFSQSSNASDEDALLTEDPDIETVLLGTSFSAVDRLNFAGFLQEYLKAPLENYALPAGRQLGSWITFSETKSNPAPKVIIWEVLPYYLLTDSIVLAQILPRIQGGCINTPLLFKSEGSLTSSHPESSIFFFGEKTHDISKKELVFDINFQGTPIHNIKFNVWYSKGKIKRGKIEFPQVNTTGHFIFSLYGETLAPQGDIIALELTKINNQLIDDYLAEHQLKKLEAHMQICKMPSYSNNQEQ